MTHALGQKASGAWRPGTRAWSLDGGRAAAGTFFVLGLAWCTGCFSTGPGVAAVAYTERIHTVTTRMEFESRVLQAARPVVVVFVSQNCPACRDLKRNLPGLATQYAGQMEFVEIDDSQDDGLAETYDVRQLPTTVFFCRGEIVRRMVWMPSLRLPRALATFAAECGAR